MPGSIEVEIRGRLDDAEYDRVKAFFDAHGRHIESQEREIYLLRDYPGYSNDFVSRDVDIRLRDTNGTCEIMLKRKVDNDSREEISLALKDQNLNATKKIMRALGCTKALRMHRFKEIYQYHGIEWSLDVAPHNIRYYEAELVVDRNDRVPAAREKLEMEARQIGLQVLDVAGTRSLIHQLDTEANKEVEL